MPTPAHAPVVAAQCPLLWASWLILCSYKSTIMPPISHFSSGLYKFSSPDSNESRDRVFICMTWKLFQSNSVFITLHYKSLQYFSALSIQPKTLMAWMHPSSFSSSFLGDFLGIWHRRWIWWPLFASWSHEPKQPTIQDSVRADKNG